MIESAKQFSMRSEFLYLKELLLQDRVEKSIRKTKSPKILGELLISIGIFEVKFFLIAGAQNFGKMI